MSITDVLDLAIKKSEKGSVDGAYEILYKGKTLYKAAYMTNEEWKSFFDGMTLQARKEYGAGGGDELSEKNGHPPKMASYGSSSRMIYELSHKNENFHFEKKLHTTVGGTANLDGFLEESERYIFVEAKCHEIYSPKRVNVSKCYAELYEYINEKMGGKLQIKTCESSCGRYLNVDFFYQEEKLVYFDLKQMICHLLGIATGMINGTLELKQTDFVYFLYDPTELDIEGKEKEKIEAIYQQTREECMSVDFDILFSVILNFLVERKYPNALSGEQIDELTSKFMFFMASQDFYPFLVGTKG